MADEATGTRLVGGLAGTVLSRRYRLHSKLGSGGMSTVYLAHDETLERWVAAKVLHGEISDQPDQIERFRREARSVASVSHPNVVAVIDAGEDSGHPYIVFEYVEGETLKSRIDAMGRLPVDEAVAYAIEIGRGLAAAHARRLVHRDVKPQNVLIDTEGRAKVTDFGIARSLESHGLTKTGRVLGTTDYVSPEQAMGHVVDARSDIYSLGVLLYEMLTGRVPFEAETQVGVAMKHVNEPIPDVQSERPEVSSAVAAVIDRATAKDPAARYPSMAEMLDDLEATLEVEVARAGGPSHGEATTVIESVRERRRLLDGRRISIASIAIVAVGAAVALAIALLAGESEPDEGGGPGQITEGEAIPVESAADFDPEGTGEGEHPEEAQNVLEGREGAWTTETYQTTLADADKSGVGLILEAEEPVEASEVGITSGSEGWDLEIYASAKDRPPAGLGGWGDPVAEQEDVATDESVELDLEEPARYYLIWITQLVEEDDGFRVEIEGAGLSG